MPTHQSLSGTSDDDLLQRMVKTHPERFGDAYWKFFDAHVAPHLPSRLTMIDLGCGPGLFLRNRSVIRFRATRKSQAPTCSIGSIRR